jgi:hypothetical protein
MTTGASTVFETTVNITTVSEIPGNNGPQWKVQCKFPWTSGNFEDSVYLEQSAFPEAPATGIHRVEVAFRSLKNKQGGGKHSGTHYWMNNYYINKIVGPADQMNPQPNNSTPWPGREEEAERNRAEFLANTGNAPAPSGNAPANGNGGHYDPSAPYDLFADRRTYGQIKGHCENAVIAMMDKLPGLFDEEGNPNWDMFVFHRDEFYNHFSAIDITVYAEAPPENTANEPPPTAPAPEPDHYCERHGVGFNHYSTGYQHKVAGTNGYCHEGIPGIWDENGKKLEEPAATLPNFN